MTYHPMLFAVDEWVLWALIPFVPLLGLVTMTAFIVLHRERKTATASKQRLNLVMASSSALLILFILGFMLFNGLRIEANKANTAENLKQQDISSSTARNADNR